MCQPTSKDHVHLLWASWGSWPKNMEAGCAAWKDLCFCKHIIALYIPSLLHIYMSWLKHKSFFCKDVGFWSEFTYVLEKMLNVPILMFSSLHVSLMTVTCRHQFKGQPSPVRHSHLLKTRGCSPFLFISTCLSSSPNHAIPLLCHAGFGLMSISTSTWQVLEAHGWEWGQWGRKVQFSFGGRELCRLTASPEAICAPNAGWLAKARSSKSHKPKHVNRPSSLQSSYTLSSACARYFVG